MAVGWGVLQVVWRGVCRQEGSCQDPCLVWGLLREGFAVGGWGHMYVGALLGVSAKHGCECPSIPVGRVALQPTQACWHSSGYSRDRGGRCFQGGLVLPVGPGGRFLSPALHGWDGTRLIAGLEGRCGRGSSCSQGQPGKMYSHGGDGEGSQPLILPCSLSPAPPGRAGTRGGSAAAVPAHEGMSPHGMLHLDEGQLPHRHLAGTQHLKTALLVEGHEEIFAHEQGAPGEGQAPQVLQVSPHEDGALALLPEGAVHGQHVDVHSRAPRLMQGQGRLPRGEQELV